MAGSSTSLMKHLARCSGVWNSFRCAIWKRVSILRISGPTVTVGNLWGSVTSSSARQSSWTLRRFSLVFCSSLSSSISVSSRSSTSAASSSENLKAARFLLLLMRSSILSVCLVTLSTYSLAGTAPSRMSSTALSRPDLEATTGFLASAAALMSSGVIPRVSRSSLGGGGGSSLITARSSAIASTAPPEVLKNLSRGSFRPAMAGWQIAMMRAVPKI
mmetsp:Transcript_19756/g.48487  ORF Transcript_19756/g.48487 Transcript_19756/m.48487 type:complete len:217 (+) Transcript_19756:1167-1817(+)